MIRILVFLPCLFLYGNVNAQKVYSTDAAYKADVAIYVVDAAYKADLLVCIG